MGGGGRSAAAEAGWLERHQVALYVGALVVGAGAGLAAPGIGAPLEAAIAPVLGLLLFATFLGVPVRELAGAFRGGRFLATVLVLNFVVVPAVVFGLTRFVADDEALLVGALLVLLAPCVDYVIVFTGLAGGARAPLLAATPVLMVVQLALLPVFMLLFGGPAVVGSLDVAPLVTAFVTLIVLPLALAALVQWMAAGRAQPSPAGERAGGPSAGSAGAGAAGENAGAGSAGAGAAGETAGRGSAGRRSAAARVGRAVEGGAAASMVPLMMVTLAVVVASQVAAVGAELPALARVVPVYVAFAVVMPVLGIAAARVARLDVAGARAVVFSGTTRNSLVVLPLALSVAAIWPLAPLAVVTQTLVELVAMVVLVAVVPRLLPERPGRARRPHPDRPGASM